MSEDTRQSAEARRVVPAKFAHAVLRTNKFEAMVSWYRTVLLAEIVYSTRTLAFMTYDDEHHRLAIAAFPNLIDRPPHSAGLDHLAYTYASLEDLLFTYERLKNAGIAPVVTLNHGPTTSLYYRDPDGNKVELQIDNFATIEELKGFFTSGAFAHNPIGITIDPSELMLRLRAGVPAAELTRYDPAGRLDPAMMAQLVQ